MNKVPSNMIIKKISPTFTTVVTTMEKYQKDETNSSGLIDPTKTEGSLKEYLLVVAVGSNVRMCKVGDLVKIDPTRYAEYKQRKVPNVAEEIEGYEKALVGYKFKIVEVDGERCLLLQDNDIEYVVDEYEELKVPKIYTNPSNLSN